MKRGKWMGVVGLVVLLLGLVACSTGSYTNDALSVNDQQSIYARVQPVPRFDWSQDRDTLIQIYRAKNTAVATWAVVTSTTGVPLWTCPSQGFPIPADTQLTNPLVNVTQGAVIEQPEPNGTYSSHNTDATYLLCVRPNGDVVPIYTEDKVILFPFAVQIVNGTIVAVEASPSSVTITRDRPVGRP